MREASRIAYWSGAIAFGLLLSSCSDPAAEADTDPAEPGALRGILRSGTADYFDEDRSEKVYALQRKDGSLVSLKFSERPAAPAGSEIFVWGPQRADGIHVERLKVAKALEKEGIGTQRSGLIDPPPLMPPIRAAFVSVSAAYSKEMLDARITREDFIKPVLEVSSYGRWTTEWQVFGPLVIPNDCGGSFYANVGNNGVAAMKAAGIDTTQFDQIQFLLGSTFTSCGWGGFGLDGHTPIRTDGLRGQYNPWSYVKGDSEGVMVQEIGHNWGLAHEHFCPNTQTPTPRCANYDEYGSPFTPMASGNNVYLNAWERIQMNFFSGCNVLTVGQSGSYDIGSISLPCNGPQVLRIKAGPSDGGDYDHYYYLEYRTPIGIDKTNGVLVHYAADIKKGGWTQCDWRGPDCPEDYLINPISATKQQALLPAGTEWTTPQGVGIKIVSLGETAKFELTFATPGGDGPTCLDGEPWDCMAPVCKGSTGNGGAGAGGGTSGCAPDAGAPDSGSGTGGSGGATGGATTTTGTGGSGGETDDGCGCHVPGSGTPRGASIFAASAALALATRWRRRSRIATRS
jgi:MYXO-CTERM domain-containing protein